MGRARSNQALAAVRDFEAVFGTRRGAPAAQAARDAAEHNLEVSALDGELNDFIVGVSARGDNPSGLAELLVSAYRRDSATKVTVAVILAWLKRDAPLSAHPPVLLEMVAALDVGDPDLIPGLTYPVLVAFCELLANDPHDPDPGTTKKYAEQVINGLFRKPRSDSFYQRLSPVCATIAGLIADPREEGSAALGLAAIRALEVAPEDALTDAFALWINAFVNRIAGSYSFPRHDRELVSRVLVHHAPGSVGALALSELQARL
jgi:hypothetical protein